VGEERYPDPRLSLKALIAAELRLLRRELGLTGAQLGQIMKVDKTLVSRIENGQRPLQLEHARLLDAHVAGLRGERFGVNGADAHHPRFEALVLLVARQPSDDWNLEHIQQEQRAHTLKLWEPLFVPGLLQTESYAREVYTSTDVPMDVDRLVERRMERQKILARPDPPRLWVLLEEGVLDRPAGGREVMREQLARLLELGERPNITIRVVRKGKRLHQGLEGPFKIMLFSGELPMAYTEAAVGWRLVSNPTDVDSFALRHDLLGSIALTREDSRTLIREYMEKMT
jgi:transcriptional regulator with XRE-family HTH domain